MNDPVYYRVIESKNSQDVTGLVVVTLQSFDEYDYDQSKFATEEKFKTDDEARAYIEKQELRILRALYRMKVT